MNYLIDFIKYLTFVITVLSTAYIFSNIYKNSNLLISLTIAFLFSNFIALPMLYNATVKKIHKLMLLKKSYKERGLIYRFLKGRTLIFIFVTVYSVVSSLFMINQFVFMSVKDWVFLSISAIIFYFVFNIVQKHIKKEIKDFYDTVLSLKISIAASAFFSSILYVIFIFFTKMGNSNINNLIYLYNQKIPLETSFLKGFLYNYTICSNIAKDTFLTFVQSQSITVLTLLAAVFVFLYFMNMNIIFSLYLIGLKELKRIFSKLEETDEPPPIKIETSVTVGFIAGIVFIILTFSFLELENYLRVSWSNIVKDSKFLCIRTVEKIDGIIVEAGTYEKIEKELKNPSIPCKISEKYEKKLFSAIDRSFSKVEKNVDLFLDNFYSLKGEYARLLYLGLGNLEEYLQKEMQGTLFKGDPFKDIEDVFKKIENDNELKNELFKTLEEKVRKIEDENKVFQKDIGGLVVEEKNINVNSYIEYYLDKFLKNFKSRLFISSSSTVITTFLAIPFIKKTTKKVALKLSEKFIIKTTGKSIGKILLKGLIGSTTGSVVGTVVPVVGNIAGAGIGFIIGIAAGIAADEIILKIDESFNREQFKQFLLSVLEEEKNELKRKIENYLGNCQ